MNRSESIIASVSREAAWTLLVEDCMRQEYLTDQIRIWGFDQMEIHRALFDAAADAAAWGRIAVERSLR